jgi:hypothetical protein
MKTHKLQLDQEEQQQDQEEVFDNANLDDILDAERTDDLDTRDYSQQQSSVRPDYYSNSSYQSGGVRRATTFGSARLVSSGYNNMTQSVR